MDIWIMNTKCHHSRRVESKQHVAYSVTVKVAEQCELANVKSANITLPPNQSQAYMQIQGFGYDEPSFLSLR